ncbi:monothiol glutaredoxin-S15, mitochondrial isoform X1 [Raphanus sativus]|uniref:Monothiol glutaredoxin-S15, mitochondrial isoform X1 n=1 Tax=Raphanus sativus TaxID=3726 RepID=A0A6J0JBG9_RAPSA|nr:monothiol glutaredoxin-S15, mitochondrial isoform X1 [Raphanus sativus]
MTRDRFGSVHPSKKRSRHLHRAVIPRQCSQFSRASNSLKRVKNYLLLCSVRSRRRRKLRFSIASRNLCLDLEMAAALSSKFLKGIASLHSLRSTRLASASYVNQNGMMRYSTTVPSDSDTHDDFKPTQKVPSGSTDSLKDIVENDVKENPVMIYMKGVPEAPQCGFSSLAVRVLQQYTIGLRFHRSLSRESLLEAQTSSLTCTRKVNWRRSLKMSLEAKSLNKLLEVLI